MPSDWSKMLKYLTLNKPKSFYPTRIFRDPFTFYPLFRCVRCRSTLATLTTSRWRKRNHVRSVSPRSRLLQTRLGRSTLLLPLLQQIRQPERGEFHTAKLIDEYKRSMFFCWANLGLTNSDKIMTKKQVVQNLQMVSHFDWHVANIKLSFCKISGKWYLKAVLMEWKGMFSRKSSHQSWNSRQPQLVLLCLSASSLEDFPLPRPIWSSWRCSAIPALSSPARYYPQWGLLIHLLCNLSFQGGLRQLDHPRAACSQDQPWSPISGHSHPSPKCVS